MSAYGEKYIAKLRQEVEEARKASVRRGISELNLYEEVKVYAPSDITGEKEANAQGYYESETVNGETRYYYNTTREAEISDDEYELICELREEKRKYNRGDTGTTGNSPAALFLKIVSWVLWLGGIIVAFVSANVEVYGSYGYTGDTEFSASIFFTTLFTYAMYGALTMCAAELLNNVNRILNVLAAIRKK